MKFIFTCLFFLIYSVCFCNDSIQVSIVNQYKKKVPNAGFTINNLSYFTDSKGNLFLPAAFDSVKVSGGGYRSSTHTHETVLKEKQIIVEKKFSWLDLLTPMFYIIYGGVWLLLFIIFAETGLFVGFFFPGDSLLFVAGILSTTLVDSISLNTGSDFLNLLIIAALCTLAGVLGNTVGYITGRKVGPAMFAWKDGFIFKQRYLHQAREFYEKHGGGAIIFARFLPFIRTFAPIVAGIVNMERKKFGFYNIVGCVAWVVSMLFIGHYLNSFTKKQFGFDLEEHLEVIVIGIVLLTTAPVLMKLFFRGGKKSAAV